MDSIKDFYMSYTIENYNLLGNTKTERETEKNRLLGDNKVTALTSLNELSLENYNKLSAAEKLNYVKKHFNYDGVIAYNIEETTSCIKSDDYIAFEPEQNKLADGTKTTFDGNNPDIRFDLGGEIERYKEQGILELNFYPTNSEHAKEHNVNANNPLYIQNLLVKESDRLKHIGKKVLLYLDEYAKKNGHDVIFGYINQKAIMTKDNRTGYFTEFTDIDFIKHWLFRNGYNVNRERNDFHKVIASDSNDINNEYNPDIRYAEGGGNCTKW
jgi:hypothetical protein